MDNEAQTPDAQGTPVEANTQPVAQPQETIPDPAQQQHAGFQKRIDKLTAEKYDAERRAAEMQQTVLNLMAQQATVQQQQARPAEPAIEIDPEQKRIFDAMMAPVQAQFQRQLSQQAAMTADFQLAAIVSGQHQAVQARTKAIWDGWKAQGLHTQGATVQNALTYALGELAPQLIEEARAGHQVQAGQQFAARGSSPLSTQSAAPTGNPNADVEPDIESDPEAAAAFYAKRLGNKSVI